MAPTHPRAPPNTPKHTFTAKPNWPQPDPTQPLITMNTFSSRIALPHAALTLLACLALPATTWAAGAAAATGATTAAANAANAQTLPSGVKVVHTAMGTGANPKASDTVQVHYRGTLADGKEFDSSFKRNAPATFPLGRVIPCWTQGVQTMKVGGKATLTCPPDTAYGARGAGASVPPNATLTFEVELLAIGP